MTDEELSIFVDCITYENCTVRFQQETYWCLGLTFDEKTKLYSIGAFVCENEPPYNYIREVLSFESPSKDECMKHFLEDKYWDGKSFYEVAPELEWANL
ncbi:MAG: hypothetical protein K6B46_04375 [Opitutales bacterium]|nr:hypothetical protein [Opitutales bacterium]